MLKTLKVLLTIPDKKMPVYVALKLMNTTSEMAFLPFIYRVKTHFLRHYATPLKRVRFPIGSPISISLPFKRESARCRKFGDTARREEGAYPLRNL